MTATYTQARNEIFATFKDKWEAAAPAIAGYLPKVHWQGVEEQGKIEGLRHWARASTQTVIAEQTSLAMNVGEEGKIRYTESGLVFIQLFAPKSDGNGQYIGGLLAQVARSAFRKTSTDNCVWFRNARINELDPEDLFYRFNVVAEFEYDEVV